MVRVGLLFRIKTGTCGTQTSSVLLIIKILLNITVFILHKRPNIFIVLT